MTIADIEQFLADHRNIALAFFSCTGFLWGLVATINRYKQMIKDKTQEAVERALVAQRHKFQAGYFDVQEARQEKLLDNYVKLAIEVERLKKSLNHASDDRSSDT